MLNACTVDGMYGHHAWHLVREAKDARSDVWGN